MKNLTSPNSFPIIGVSMNKIDFINQNNLATTSLLWWAVPSA
jgi:hypothetical protein